jgi:hypothetical protein
MIFVGDFIDRGPQQRGVLKIARSMCEAGTAMAVMGNHEFNAIGWVTRKRKRVFLRKHSTKNKEQHAAFLSQIGKNSRAHEDAIKWFRTLPLWLNLDGLRVVHACWHDPSRKALAPFLNDAGCLTKKGVLESYRHGSVAHSAVDILLKGPEERLPAGIDFIDKDGIGGKRFGYVGGIKTRQRFERPPLGWKEGRRKYRTLSSRRTIGITKASLYSSAIIGSRVGRKLQRQTRHASISALLRKDI